MGLLNSANSMLSVTNGSSRDRAGIEARYVRVEVNGSTLGTQARELEIYGTASTTTPDTPSALTIRY